ncbi:hypothetical protein RF11_04896 [Thelohanellus kitauei]|uniref:Uncharacterized protein n=1 Tax=Thelohanellus kitauei TaxID=669202 RepID=A0A0C2MFZ7_THEKT|nr:hypothetical protein RF11_04896 [Thelohanellus kitauei]
MREHVGFKPRSTCTMFLHSESINYIYFLNIHHKLILETGFPRNKFIKLSNIFHLKSGNPIWKWFKVFNTNELSMNKDIFSKPINRSTHERSCIFNETVRKHAPMWKKLYVRSFELPSNKNLNTSYVIN